MRVCLRSYFPPKTTTVNTLDCWHPPPSSCACPHSSSCWWSSQCVSVVGSSLGLSHESVEKRKQQQWYKLSQWHLRMKGNNKRLTLRHDLSTQLRTTKKHVHSLKIPCLLKPWGLWRHGLKPNKRYMLFLALAPCLELQSSAKLKNFAWSYTS